MVQKFETPTGKYSVIFETDFTNFTGIPFKANINFINEVVCKFNQTINHANVFHDWSNLYYQTPQCDERFIR